MLLLVFFLPLRLLFLFGTFLTNIWFFLFFFEPCFVEGELCFFSLTEDFFEAFDDLAVVATVKRTVFSLPFTIVVRWLSLIVRVVGANAGERVEESNTIAFDII